MNITSVNVAVALHQILNGAALPNARLRFELTGADIDGGLVLAPPVYITLPEDGHGSVALWPNVLGTQGTQTRVTCYSEGGAVQFTGYATIPNADCNLHEVLTLIAPPRVDDAQAAALVAQAAAARARSYSSSVLFTFDVSTALADPGAGRLRLDAPTLAAATFAYISATDRDGNPAGPVLAQLTTDWRLGLREGATGKVGQFRVTGPAVGAGGYLRVPVALVAGGAGTFTEGGILGVSYVQAAPLTLGTSAPSQVLFNDAGGVAGAGMTWDRATNTLTVPVAGSIASPVFRVGGAATLRAPAAGVLTLGDQDGTDFSRLQFGGASAAFPALRRTGAGLDVVTADGSSWAQLQAGAGIFHTGLTVAGSIASHADLTVAGSIASQGTLATGAGSVMKSDMFFGWSSVGVLGPYDVTFFRGGPGILEQRNGANAQAFRVYGTYTDGSNWARVRCGHSATAFELMSDAAGTGPSYPLRIGTAISHHLYLATAGTDRWAVTNQGHLRASADNAYDIGAATTSRPRSGYFGTSVEAPRVTTTARTVAALGTAAAAGAGSRAFVTDATLPAAGNFGAAVVGGGANKVPVYSDGVDWFIG